MRIFFKKLFYFLFPVLILSSCVPGKEIVFESLTPAPYTLPANAEKFIILNSSYTPKFDTLDFNVLRKLEKEEQFIIDTLIINNIFDGFFYTADESPLQGLRNSIYVEERSEDTLNFLRPLSNESIRFLLGEFRADAVISLEYYGMNYRYYFKSPQMNNMDLLEHQAYLSIDRALVWRIYTDSGLMKSHTMRDTLYWTAYGYNKDDALESLPDLTAMVKEVFWFAGEEFASQLSPVWEETQRSYFWLTDQGIDQSLEPSYLREIISEQTGLKAYKAYFNLSIYHERQGEVDEALKYMNKALEIRPGATLAKFYRKKLQEKVEEYEKLKEQMN